MVQRQVTFVRGITETAGFSLLCVLFAISQALWKKFASLAMKSLACMVLSSTVVGFIQAFRHGNGI